MAGQGTFLLAQWVVISYLAHTAGATAVGQYSLAVSLTAPAAVLLGFAGRTILQMDTGKHGLPFRTYFHLRLITTLMFVLSGIAIMLWRSDDPVLSWLIMAMTAMKAVDNFSDITYGLAQRHHHQDIMSVSMVVRGVMSAGLFIAVYALTDNMPLGAMAVAFGWLVFFLGHDWTRTRQWHGELWKWQPADVLQLAKSSLPLGIAVFLSGFAVVVPRLVLEYFEGTEMLGVFSALGYTLTLGNLYVGAISTTLLTRMGELWEAGDLKNFFKRIFIACAIVAGTGLLGVGISYFYGKPVLGLIYGEGFSRYYNEFFYTSLAVAVVMISTLLANMLVGTKKYKVQLVISTITLISVSLVSIVLIAEHGLMGAIFSMLFYGIFKLTISILRWCYEYKIKSNH